MKLFKSLINEICEETEKHVHFEKLPDFFKELLQKQYSKEDILKIVSGYNSKRYVTLRINTLKTTSEEVQKKLQQSNIKYKINPNTIPPNN